jgi:hypothetical protein
VFLRVLIFLSRSRSVYDRRRCAEVVRDAPSRPIITGRTKVSLAFATRDLLTFIDSFRLLVNRFGVAFATPVSWSYETLVTKF